MILRVLTPRRWSFVVRDYSVDLQRLASLSQIDGATRNDERRATNDDSSVIALGFSPKPCYKSGSTMLGTRHDG